MFVVIIFGRYIVFRNFVSDDFRFFGVLGFLDTGYRFSLERLSFFRQFFHTFRIGARYFPQSFDIPRLASGFRARPVWPERD
jgi:hypothetical protein